MPTEQMLSVIIPTLNEEKDIACLLQSLVALPWVEIIVSDGGSSDATLEICRRFPVQVITAPAGRGGQLNAGAQCASGDILWFLHADSRIESGLVDEIRQAVSQGHRWGCSRLQFSEDTPIFRAIAVFSNLRVMLSSSCYGDQGIYCQKDLFHIIGGFPAKGFLEDIKFSHRLRKQQRAHLLRNRITTSTRRFRSQGVGKTLSKMQVVKVLFCLGIQPEGLWKWYQRD